MILGIDSHASATVAGLLDADIRFRDDDGDANLLTYELISATATRLEITGDPFTIAAEKQKTGATVTINWNCLGEGYEVRLNAIMVDQKGHRSDKAPFLLNCP